MGSRKLRLLLLAYLRGSQDLVRPGYPNGVRSGIRENFILSAIDLEATAKHGLLQEQLMITLMAPALKPSALESIAAQVRAMVNYWQQLLLMNGSARPPRSQGSVDALAKVYQALKKSTFFDMIREQHFRLNPEARNA